MAPNPYVRRPYLAVVLAVGVVAAAMMFGSFVQNADQFADANTLKKVHFTQTITSSVDPGIEQAGEQLAFVLLPNPGTLYDGSMTFAASVPVRPMVLHAIASESLKETAGTGLPTWTVDNRTTYAVSVVGPATDASSFEFTGAAVALLGNSTEFAATVSVDGWVRGAEPAKTVLKSIEVELPAAEPTLLLSRASVPVVIPMHKGIYDGQEVAYIMTDASDADYASELTQSQNWQVEHAPALSGLPEIALQQIYVFRNGVDGGGIYGYQDEVFSSTRADVQYSALSEVIEVVWKPGQKRVLLESVDDILRAEEGGRITLESPVVYDDDDDADMMMVVVNAPQIVWPGGQMDLREDDASANDDDDKESSNTNDKHTNVDIIPYGGGQVTEIDMEEMTVTFVAHRGWGPDGKTTYHIVTGATPKRPALLMGVEATPTYASMVNHSGASDLYVFENGIRGSGSLGFQPGIAAVVVGDDAYTPVRRINVVEWHDPGSAEVLETMADIDSFRDKDMLTTSIARPTNSYYVINAPTVDPFQ